MKNNLFFIFTMVQLLGCNQKNEKYIALKKSDEIIDINKGFYAKYPFIQQIDFLKLNNQSKNLTLKRILTKNNITYKLNNVEIPLEFKTTIDFISLSENLDSHFEKKFEKTPKNGFVIIIENKSTIWNYLYEINEENKKITLTNIFYYEPRNNIQNDTIGYLVKFPINDLQNKIYNINNFKNWKKINEKVEKFEIK